jgi:putative hemolysin
MNYLGRIAQVGDVVRISSARFTITSMIGKRVGQILLSKEDRK